MSVMELLAPWAAINAALGLAAPIRDEAHYVELLAFAEEAFERFGSDDAHPIFGLVSVVADRIREYEDKVHPWPDSTTPGSLLAYLMTEHELRQADLPEVGTQSVISEIIAGKRELNLRQVKSLARRFHLPMEAFVV